MKLLPSLLTGLLSASLLLTASLVSAQEQEMTLAERMAMDNPLMIFYVKHSPEDPNKPLLGVRLSDGSLELKGARLLDYLNIPEKKQHIYTFKMKEGHEQSYVWIDKGGQPLPIPIPAGDKSGENAFIVSGDIYTSSEVRPGDGMVILPGGNLAWLQKLKAETK